MSQLHPTSSPLLAGEPDHVTVALDRLRKAATATRDAWPDLTWTRESGPGPDVVDYVGGRFRNLDLAPGEELVLSTRLVVPDELAGVSTVGDSVEVAVNTLYPAQLEWDGVCLFDDLGSQDVMAAPSPVLLCVAPALAEGGSTLRLTVQAPDNQLMPWWVHVVFTTPGLRRRWELLDVAWARLALARALASTPADEDAVAKAATLVPELLVTTDEAGLTTALDAMAEALQPFAERAAAIDVHVVSHCHIDLSWLWTWPDTEATILRDVRSVLALLDDYPELTFTHSQPETYEVVRKKAPQMFERIVEHVRSGRWEAATMTWVEGDTNLASGEALARQLVEGVTWTEEHLGLSPRVYMAPDNFGHAGNLPQLARSAGADVYYHFRANPGGPDFWPAYWWEGDDGSRILALSSAKYSGDISAGELANAAIRALRHGHELALHFHGVGDHGGGPARQHLDAMRRLADVAGLPSARCSTIGGFADALLATSPTLPVHHGESRTIFEGCYSTQSASKRWNRDAEQAMVTADTVATLAGLDDAVDELSDPWRTVLFNHFHDIIAGSSIAEVYEQHEQDFRRVEAATADVIDRSLAVLSAAAAARPDAGAGGDLVAVTNPSGWERTDIVEVDVAGGAPGAPVWLVGSHGHETAGQPTSDGRLCFVATVPAWSTVTYRAVADPGTLPQPLTAVPCFAPNGGRQTAVLDIPDVDVEPFLRIDTPLLRAYVRRDSGIVTSLVDKRVVGERELVAFGMRRPSDYQDSARVDLAVNVLQLVEEKPHGMSAWHLAEVWRETTLLGTATTEVVEEGPVRVVLEVRHTIGSGPSTVVQRLAFYRDLARVDVDSDIDWREAGGPDAGVPSLKVATTARLRAAEAWFETPFGAVNRPPDGQESPALRWAWVGDDEYGFAVVNDSKYGHEVLGTRLRVTLARSAYSPDPVADQGRQRARYAIVPGPGTWREAGVARTAAGFNQPLLGRAVPTEASTTATGSAPLGWRPVVSGGVLPTLFRRSRDGAAWILRLSHLGTTPELATVGALPAGAEVAEATISEHVSRRLAPAADGTVTVSLRPYEVKTLRITAP